MKLKNYAYGSWIEGEGEGVALYNAVTGEKIFEATSQGLDFANGTSLDVAAGYYRPTSWFHVVATQLPDGILRKMDRSK